MRVRLYLVRSGGSNECQPLAIMINERERREAGGASRRSNIFVKQLILKLQKCYLAIILTLFTVFSKHKHDVFWI